ncbi:TIGR01459 family HAD-type hydrolase [Acuticoccus mangrovi]|uniref:TIGR01459 family HAD-type hydrolase n=1 Tax=Acuticoccus mangrovi TaxID=2796142 RepID=A0A934MI81_9HYPH|nr:TIGR01459 family HAD-type hydrolase [Acuticoccus mangrovi]MBJ3777670.1 TIGR01459 family HAD-type hydrolase [Acuticoccus mangrovi]
MQQTLISGLSSIADDYDAILCDVWGVLHDGLTAHEGVADALARFRENGPVVLITNAPRPSHPVVAQLKSFGIPETTFDSVVSSGDVVRKFLAEKNVRTVYHIGPTRDLPLYENLPITLVEDPADADAIMCAGLRDDDTESAEDYRAELAGIVPLDKPFICANPDIVVERGGRLVYCAGALGQLYDQLGGTVLQFGKPHDRIYEAAIAEVKRLKPDATRILAVGDGLPTDVTGANRQGLDVLFITDGIHAEELGEPGHPDLDKVAARLAAEELTATHFATRLVW